MKFLIVTHVIHKQEGGRVGGYAPYIREMNLWLKHVESVRVIAPMEKNDFGSIDLAYAHPMLDFIKVPSFNLTSAVEAVRTALLMPLILYRIFQGMLWADHIHIRCPGNMGLLACLVQMLFPQKPKTAKYAGNWDPDSPQPISYRAQRWILKNTFLTRNMQALVYGEWPVQGPNIKPFFTATYHDTERQPFRARNLHGEIRLVFIGALSAGKRPLLAVETATALIHRGHAVTLDLLGEGPERAGIQSVVKANGLTARIRLMGNVDAETVKGILQSAHFLIFLSRSEGWPKAVAEAMFWGCVPITTAISCVPYMLGNGSRGSLINPDVNNAVEAIEGYVNDQVGYLRTSKMAAEWSRQYTLEKFDSEIIKLLKSSPAF